MIGAASTFITCSELDPLRDEALDYARQLMRTGIRTDLHVLGGTCHGFDSLRPDWELSQAVWTSTGSGTPALFRPALNFTH